MVEIPVTWISTFFFEDIKKFFMKPTPTLKEEIRDPFYICMVILITLVIIAI
jgi:hypothetical protein